MGREEGELLGDGVLVEHTRLVDADSMRIASHEGWGLSREKSLAGRKQSWACFRLLPVTLRREHRLAWTSTICWAGRQMSI